MTSDTIWQIIRYAMIAVGGYFVNRGFITGESVEGVIAAIGTLFTVGWGIWVKYGTKATTAEVADRPSVPVVSPATGIVGPATGGSK